MDIVPSIVPSSKNGTFQNIANFKNKVKVQVFKVENLMPGWRRKMYEQLYRVIRNPENGIPSYAIWEETFVIIICNISLQNIQIVNSM